MSDTLPGEDGGESPLQSPNHVGRRKPPAGARRKLPAGVGEQGGEVKKRKRRKKGKVIVNTSFCKYDAVRKAASDLDWVEDPNEDGEQGQFNLFWTDTSVAIYRVMKLQNWQRINHFPSMHTIARKVQLSMTLSKMRKPFPQHFSFSPRTWSLRSEKLALKKFIATTPAAQKRTFIVKPSAGCQGKGIFMTQSVDDLNDDVMEDAVVQEYINKPLLIENKKFDLRVYALVTSVKHLGIFLFNEGLVRLATVDYEKPAEDNLHDLQMHLTNYAINKTSDKFIHNDDADRGDIGHKRDFAFLNKWLEAEGHEPEKIWGRIERVIIKTLLAAQPILSHTYTSCFPHNNDGYTCYEILGFDLLLDQQLKPWLLEVNHSPSFNCCSPLDERIKTGLIEEVLKVINLKPDDRVRERDREKDEFARRMDAQARRAAMKKAGAEEAELRQMEQDEADTEKARVEEFVKTKRKEEDSLVTNFRRIYPAQDESRQQLYEQFIEAAIEVNAPTTTLATVQREQEGRKEREKQREKQEREEALRRGLQRPKSPSIKQKRAVNFEDDGSGDGRPPRQKKVQVNGEDAANGKGGVQWQQKLDQQMERHKRRISLGPRLSVFQLRDQYMTAPVVPVQDGLEVFAGEEDMPLGAPLPEGAVVTGLQGHPGMAGNPSHPRNVRQATEGVYPSQQTEQQMMIQQHVAQATQPTIPHRSAPVHPKPTPGMRVQGTNAPAASTSAPYSMRVIDYAGPNHPESNVGTAPAPARRETHMTYVFAPCVAPPGKFFPPPVARGGGGMVRSQVRT
eukprot:TRINITY_DN29863_c0_g1_i1.p1 TRINITY_DN29863_c0_g1~~TRINITY_DN29863_c0_g1_i1.p1  ORF type:complete len:790 (+),score=323.91 TRINITY_DN29863_c0_g1_i1:142-2511(+)